MPATATSTRPRVLPRRKRRRMTARRSMPRALRIRTSNSS